MNSDAMIHWIIIIVDRGKGNKVSQFFQKEQIPFMLMIPGHGTASSKMMDYLGLDEPNKDILISMAFASDTSGILARLNHLIQFCRPGHGIAFTIPLSGISKAASGRITQNLPKQEPKKEDSTMSNQSGQETSYYELIVTIINNGKSDLVMDAAKSAGCTGGTIVKARSAYSDEIRKVFRLTMPQEKEIVLILAPASEKLPIMKAICSVVLQKTGEHASVFSIPVNDAKGISPQL